MKEIMKNDAANDTSTRDNDVTTNTTYGTFYNNDYDDTLYGDDETAAWVRVRGSNSLHKCRSRRTNPPPPLFHKQT